MRFGKCVDRTNGLNARSEPSQYVVSTEPRTKRAVPYVSPQPRSPRAASRLHSAQSAAEPRRLRTAPFIRGSLLARATRETAPIYRKCETIRMRRSPAQRRGFSYVDVSLASADAAAARYNRTRKAYSRSRCPSGAESRIQYLPGAKRWRRVTLALPTVGDTSLVSIVWPTESITATL